MANKKIQITNKSGDNCFPVTRKECIEGFDHTHSFSGSSTPVTVTGNYDKATSVKVNSFTPTVSATLTRSKDVLVSTATIQQITGVGTLPTKENKTVATNGIKSVGATFVGDKDVVVTESITTAAPATYTPEGSVSQSSFSGTVNLGSNTTATSGVKYIEDVSHTAASASETQSVVSGVNTTTGNFLTGITASTTSGGINYLEDVSVSGGTTTRTLSYMHFSAGSVPSRSSFTYVSSLTPGKLEGNTTSSGGIQYVHNVSGGGATAKTGSYTPAGSVTGSFIGTAATITVTGTPTGTISLSGGTLPTLSSVTTSATGDIKYLEDVSYTAPTVTKTTIGQITSVGSLPTLATNQTVSGGIKYAYNVGGGGASSTDTFIKSLKAGSGSLSSTLSGKTLYISHSHTATTVGSTGTAVTGVSPATASYSYLHFGQGTLPGRSTIDVVTGVSGGSVGETTRYLRFNKGALRSGATFIGSQLSLKGSYTPAGTLDLKFAGTATNIVTGVTSNAVSTTLSYLHYTPTSGATATAYQITGVGSAPTFTCNTTASGGIQYVHDISSSKATATKTVKYLKTSADTAVKSVSTTKVDVVSGINGGSISKTTKYFHPSVTGTITTPSFTGKPVRLVHTAKGTVNVSTTPADTTTVSSITGVGTLPTRAGVTVVTGISQQPEFTASATASTITPTATLSHTSTSITSNGTCKPGGTVGPVQ